MTHPLIPFTIPIPRQTRLGSARAHHQSESVQKKASLGVLDNPGQTLLEVFARHRTAAQNIPPVGPDFIKSQSLGASVRTSALAKRELRRGDQPSAARRQSCIRRRRSYLQTPAGLPLKVAFRSVSWGLATWWQTRHAHLLLKQTMQFLSADVDAQPVCGVDNPDQGVCLFKVIAPV